VIGVEPKYFQNPTITYSIDPVGTLKPQGEQIIYIVLAKLTKAFLSFFADFRHGHIVAVVSAASPPATSRRLYLCPSHRLKISKLWEYSLPPNI
jgi:hypothetical protein